MTNISSTETMRGLFFGWKARHFLGAVFIAALFALVVFVDLNREAKPHNVSGRIIDIGMDTATRYSLSRLVITAELENGKVVSIEAPRHMSFKVGEEVIIVESTRLLSSGTHHRFLEKK